MSSNNEGNRNSVTRVIIARGRLYKTLNRGKYPLYYVTIHKRKGIPKDLESFVGKEVTVILADEGDAE
jgi:hypothetical protein